MTLLSSIEELRARLDLAQGSATLLLCVAADDVEIDETRRVLGEILRATPMEVADLGTAASDFGPARWAESTRSHAAGTIVFAFAPRPFNPLAITAFARLLNAERELLRGLSGPAVLVVSAATEKVLRQQAPDFYTWIAQSYELSDPRALAAAAAQLGVAPAQVSPAQPAEDPIRFLHISDLHLRPQTVKRYDQDRVLDGLVTFLEQGRASFPLDLIFVTGDLAQSGRADEYAVIVDRLQTIMAATGVPAERVFVVPGNHDVDRDAGRWLLRTLRDDEEAVAFFTEAKSRAFHEKKFSAYRESMGELLGASRPLGLGVGGEAVEIVDLKGARIAITSFNTAWFAHGDDDQGKLWLGEPGVEHAVDRIADGEASFAIALMHHPFEYLNEIERDVVERWFERGFDLVLRGHLHANKTRSIASQRGGYVEVAGPAAYQGSKWPNGCFLGEIRPQARTVRLKPYAYSSGPDPWVLDTKVFPDDETTGYCRTFTVPEKRRTKSAVARPLRDAAEAAVRGASPAEQHAIAEKLGHVPGAGTPIRHVTSTARALAETLELWSEGLEKASVGPALASRVVDEIASSEAFKERIEIDSAPAFEEALRRVGQVFLKVTASLAPTSRIPESEATFALAAGLGTIVNAPVSVEALLPGRHRADILIGRGGTPATGDVIEVERARGSGGKDRTIEEGLSRLINYMSLAHSTYGALILLQALPSSSTGPEIDHVKTPFGSDVLVMRL
ncbi:MAG: metallophosphoesterase [Minicystis sp.]